MTGALFHWSLGIRSSKRENREQGVSKTGKEGTAVITGASSGIGKTFAGLLAKRGYDLVLVARRRELLQLLADELSSSCAIHAETLPADLASEKEAAMVKQRIEAIDDLSMLVNNAGYTIVSPFADSDIERELDMCACTTWRRCV